MRWDLEIFYRHHKSKEYKTNNGNILKSDIKDLIQRSLLKNMVARKEVILSEFVADCEWNRHEKYTPPNFPEWYN